MRLSGYLTFAFFLFFTSGAFADFRVSLYDGLQQFRVSVAPKAGANSMTLFASRNETVGLQAVLFNDSDQSVEGVKITAEGFSGITVRFYAAGAVRVDRGAKTIEFPEDAYFDLLRPIGWESVEKKSFRPYWIDLKIAPDAVPGTRDGKLTFTVGEESRSVSVRIKVARSVLPVAPTLSLAFAFVKGWGEEFYGRKLTEDELFQCYDTMLEHRLGPDIIVQKVGTHAASVYIKTDDLKGKAFLRLEYLDAEKKTLQVADSLQHVSGSTGARNFRKIEARLSEAPTSAAFLRISHVAVLEPGYGANETEPLCKAFFDDVSATAGERLLKVANPGFEEKYRFENTKTDRYYAFRDRLVDCLDRACTLLDETGPFENARPGRDR